MCVYACVQFILVLKCVPMLCNNQTDTCIPPGFLFFIVKFWERDHATTLGNSGGLIIIISGGYYFS